MRLVEPSLDFGSAFLEMAREHAAAGDDRYALAIEDLAAHLHKVAQDRDGVGLAPSRVPGTEFWLEDRGAIVACARLRFWLTPELENVEGGHIGYDVRPSMRRRGYATALLGLVIGEARARGIARIRITCDADNIGSIKVIERNGGWCSSTSLSDKTGKTVRLYWVEP